MRVPGPAARRLSSAVRVPGPLALTLRSAVWVSGPSPLRLPLVPVALLPRLPLPKLLPGLPLPGLPAPGRVFCFWGRARLTVMARFISSAPSRVSTASRASSAVDIRT